MRVLIVGAGSYIGNSVADYLKRDYGYRVNVLSSRGLIPKTEVLAGYDAVLNVAGIAHRKEKNTELYYEINRDLAIEVAETAKKAGVTHVLVMSSMSVYGMDTGNITKDTEPKPCSHYGISKLQADNNIWALKDDSFKVAILRPPMVYGNGCKGNYQPLSKAAKVLPFFIETNNQRSMIYIENLCSFIGEIIDKRKEGLFFPQNAEYVNTGEMVRLIAKYNNNDMRFVKEIRGLQHIPLKNFRKVFGSLTYEKTDTVDRIDFEESIARSENKK